MLGKAGYWLGVVLLTGALAVGAKGDSGPVVLTAQGFVDGGAQGDAQIWFTLYHIDQRFVMDRSKIADPDAMMAALTASNHAQRTIVVHYDPDTAIVDPIISKPAYVVRDVVYDGKTYSGDQVTPPRTDIAMLTPRQQAEFALGRGVAYAGAADDAKAIALLDQALRAPELTAPIRTLAFKTRSSAEADEAASDWPVGDDRDRMMIKALADVRAWMKLAPDDMDAKLAEGAALESLGAYDEALGAYNDVVKRWPDKAFWALLFIGSIDYQRGDPARDVEDMKKLASFPGAADGMPYHYHRGRAFEIMGRHEDAIAEYTAGLKAQPDYSWTYRMRGCVYASLGRLSEALDDARSTLKYFDAENQGQAPSPGLAFDRQRMTAEIDTLTAAIAQDSRQKLDGQCKGYWNWGDEPRERSRLLPPKA
jgi:tetratricopeptide (TPR) repeat protein